MDRIQNEARRPASGSGKPAPRSLHIGLINNMPDGALQATERQFRKLLDTASNGILVSLSLYAIPEVPRAEWGRRRIQRFYSRLEALWPSRIDGLIVTGTEPIAAELPDEPYWKRLTEIFEWAENNTISTIWSCLAAHAAILHFDGIVRRRLQAKHFGVMKCAKVADHPLTAGAPPVVQVPHSRWNDIPETDLTSHGYDILTRTQDGGVDCFVKEGKSLFVFLQGHPEYDANTLLLEYRRDIGRYLRGERDTYPQMPQGYFDEDAAAALAGLQKRAISDRRQELLLDFPMALLEERTTNRWSAAGADLYRNWMAYLSAHKESRGCGAFGSEPDAGLRRAAAANT